MHEYPRSHGLWGQSAPPAPQTAALEGAARAKVVVVGGGYTGLSSALHLAERGVDVVLIEARKIGFGGAGRNVGLVNAGMWVMPEVLVQTLGPVYGDRLLSALGEGPAQAWGIVRQDDIVCEATRNGTLHAAVGRKGAAEIAARAPIAGPRRAGRAAGSWERRRIAWQQPFRGGAAGSLRRHDPTRLSARSGAGGVIHERADPYPKPRPAPCT